MQKKKQHNNSGHLKNLEQLFPRRSRKDISLKRTCSGESSGALNVFRLRMNNSNRKWDPVSSCDEYTYGP